MGSARRVGRFAAPQGAAEWRLSQGSRSDPQGLALIQKAVQLKLQGLRNAGTTAPMDQRVMRQGSLPGGTRRRLLAGSVREANRARPDAKKDRPTRPAEGVCDPFTRSLPRRLASLAAPAAPRRARPVLDDLYTKRIQEYIRCISINH